MGVCSSKRQMQVVPLSPTDSCPIGREPIKERVPLDERQVFRLKKSWKGIKRHLDETGVEMFARLFRTNTDFKFFFKAFSDITGEDEMRESEMLVEQAVRVMSRIDDYITHIDDHEYVSKLIRYTQIYHYKVDGYCHKYFWKMKQPFLDAVKITLGDSFTDSIEPIYVIAVDYLMAALSDGMSEDDKSLSAEEVEKQMESYRRDLGYSYLPTNKYQYVLL